MINEDFFVKIKASRGQSVQVLPKLICIKGCFGHVCESFSVYILSLDAGDKACVARNRHIFRLNRALK
jgi:hypothetical protein